MTIHAAPIAIDCTGEYRVLSRGRHPGRASRIMARVRAGSLDRELIARADPDDSPQLSARAVQLTMPRTRAQIAEGLERLLEAGQGSQGRWCAVARRDPLLANAQELSELATLLRSASPLQARGIAILSRLLADGTGPAYHGESEHLADHLREAREAMGQASPGPRAGTEESGGAAEAPFDLVLEADREY